jgi:hypothetical protein
MTWVKVLRLLRWWKIPPRGWIIILGELAVIIILASWVYSEYVNNLYFQSYVNGFSPILLPIVSVGFGITSATVATLLYFTMRNMRQGEDPKEEELPRRRSATKKAVKRPQVSSSRNERTSPGALSMAPKPKVLMTGSSSPKRGAVQESRDEEVESG